MDGQVDLELFANHYVHHSDSIW